MVFFSAMKRIRRVAIVLRMSGSAGRDILSGVFHFTRMHPNWHTRLFQMPSEFTPDAFLAESAVGLDGIIASEPGPDETAALVRDSKIPVSFIGDPGPVLSARRSGIAFTRNDDDQIGRIGARYLVSLGAHRAYGFVPTTSRQYWSDSRERGFTEELKLRKAEPVVFRSPGAAGSREDLAALKEWLAALPKPAAVMTAWDTRATQVLNLCQEARIKVPRHISVLGVDNDELLDESCVPPLTSILPDHEKLGYAAARALERLMAERVQKESRPFLIRPVKVVERESAIASTPTSHLLSSALEFIRKNAVKGIRVDDVAKALGISRRLADLRFQQFSGETINEAITRQKLDAVKKLLATTDRPIKVISEACGYTDLAYLKTLFKRRFGCTMRDWRRQNHE
ncbi:MAG: helix-turn-helix domain-containing protein [Lentisphaerae bacterium]|nr:helix-turn-helix domain-containing protein [Lentisphaerota bacterium]